MTLTGDNFILFYLIIAIALLAVAIFAYIGTKSSHPGHKRRQK
jgi:hypothetical protein